MPNDYDYDIGTGWNDVFSSCTDDPAASFGLGHTSKDWTVSHEKHHWYVLFAGSQVIPVAGRIQGPTRLGGVISAGDDPSAWANLRHDGVGQQTSHSEKPLDQLVRRRHRLAGSPPMRCSPHPSQYPYSIALLYCREQAFESASLRVIVRHPTSCVPGDPSRMVEVRTENPIKELLCCSMVTLFSTQIRKDVAPGRGIRTVPVSQAWVNQDEMFDSNLVRKVLDTVPYIVSRTADSDEHDAATAKLERYASLCPTWNRIQLSLGHEHGLGLGSAAVRF